MKLVIGAWLGLFILVIFLVSKAGKLSFKEKVEFIIISMLLPTLLVGVVWAIL